MVKQAASNLFSVAHRIKGVSLSSNSLESGRWTKSQNPLILFVIHHRQNPIESTCLVLFTALFYDAFLASPFV
jgi:hypothetical protein